jgi:endonuclease/exonuclease/phosphatase (EEP) superfamily protein YafD
MSSGARWNVGAWNVGAWGLAAGMTAVGLIRLSRTQRHPVLIGLAGIGMRLLVPAYPLTIAAVVKRKWLLAAAAAVLSAGNAVWLSRQYETGQQRCVPPGAASLRLISANILFSNPDVGNLGRDLTATDADVILLQEVSMENFARLRMSGLFEAYPYQVWNDLRTIYSSAILSRLPITNEKAIDVAGQRMGQATIATAAGTVRLINVHTIAPESASKTAQWRSQLVGLAQLRDGRFRAVIMAGDFNATSDHAPFVELTRSGLRDAFGEAGRGTGATWPQWKGPVMPLMRLDHVLVDDAVIVTSAEVQANRGSDHRRLAVDLVLPAPE